MRRLKRRGFTLSEVLISIAILSIGAFGALSALSFGLFSSGQASQMSFAQSYNKKILELIQSGLINYDEGNAANPLVVLRTTSPLNPAVADPGWRALDDAVLSAGVTDLWGSSVNDRKNWLNESGKYQCNVAISPIKGPSGSDVTGYSAAVADEKYLCQIRLVTVTTRWNARGVWKSLSTAGYLIIGARP